MEIQAVGTMSDGNIPKVIVKKNLSLIREGLLELEDLYYVFRDDTEEALGEIKYKLDKLFQLIGDKEDVD